MKPAPFRYLAPTTLDECLSQLAEYGEDGKVLAGGQSLVPLMNFRLVRPAVLIDINNVEELSYVRGNGAGVVAIGATARQRALETDRTIAEKVPLLAEALPFIGHFQIRNRGTVGGSVAHADPAGELPAVMLALGAQIKARSVRGERVIPIDRFFHGYLTTDLASDELLTEIVVPAAPSRSGVCMMEVARRHGDFALVGVAAQVTTDAGGVITEARFSLFGVAPRPVPAEAASQLAGAPLPPDLGSFSAAVSDELQPDADIHASAAYRKRVAGVLAARVLRHAYERSTGGQA